MLAWWQPVLSEFVVAPQRDDLALPQIDPAQAPAGPQLPPGVHHPKQDPPHPLDFGNWLANQPAWKSFDASTACDVVDHLPDPLVAPNAPDAPDAPNAPDGPDAGVDWNYEGPDAYFDNPAMGAPPDDGGVDGGGYYDEGGCAAAFAIPRLRALLQLLDT